MHNLGLLALDRGDRDTAEAWFNRTFEIWRKQAKPGTLEYASVLGNHRDRLRRAGALIEAETLAREVVDISIQQAPNTVVVASALASLAEVQLARQLYADARSSLEQALATPALTATYNEKSEHLHLLAQAELALGDLQPAERHARESIALRLAQSPYNVNLVLGVQDFRAGAAWPEATWRESERLSAVNRAGRKTNERSWAEQTVRQRLLARWSQIPIAIASTCWSASVRRRPHLKCSSARAPAVSCGGWPSGT